MVSRSASSLAPSGHCQPILARPPSTAYHLRKLVVRNKLATAFVATMLVGLVGFAVTMSTLYRRADAASPPVVTLKPGIVAEIEDCNEEWCRVEVRNNRGWLRRGEFWGIEPGEVIE